MKIAVINFSGNVGKSTIAHHLLLPRIPGAELVAIETINAHDSLAPSLRGRQFGELQEYLQTVDSAVIDIGASNIEELLGLMRRYRGSHEDIDCFIVPAVPDLKQQQDTIATLVELAQMGVPPSRLKLVFNMVEDDTDVAQAFEHLLAFLSEHPLAQANPACRLRVNEIFARVLPGRPGLQDIASDTTDYKALIAKTTDTAEKLSLARQLATRRLATGVVPELDACFDALDLRACAVA